jgi:hypothetical protein
MNNNIAIIIAGALVAAAIIGAALVWWPRRTAEDAAAYDFCLIERNGNTVVCDALMRERQREAVEKREREREKPDTTACLDKHEGAMEVQRMLDAGGPPAQVEAWKQDMKAKMLKAGGPSDLVDKYWEDCK